MKRVAFGLLELDRSLEGGLREKSLLLLAGNPGAGKTILASQFLYQGCAKGEKCTYFSLAENKDDFFANMRSLGMDFKKYEDEGTFLFLDYISGSKELVDKAVQAAIEQSTRFGSKRLVIDSISAIEQSIGVESARSLLHAVLGRLIKGFGMTAILIGELPVGEAKIGSGFEEFVADGVIVLKTVGGAAKKKVLDIVKMRGTAVGQSTFEYLIDKKYGGIGLISLPERTVGKFVSDEKITAGVDGIDAMLDGGVFRHSITLLRGASGIGKTLVCLSFLIKNVQNGERGLMLSFEEPVNQLNRMIAAFGCDVNTLGGRLKIESVVPEAITPLQYYKTIQEIIEKDRPAVIAIDSATAISNVLDEEDFVDLMRYIQILCKEHGITVFITSLLGTFENEAHSGVSNLADNIIVMRYYELKDRMMRELLVMKSRGSKHDNRVVPFDIEEKRGIVVKR